MRYNEGMSKAGRSKVKVKSISLRIPLQIYQDIAPDLVQVAEEIERENSGITSHLTKQNLIRWSGQVAQLCNADAVRSASTANECPAFPRLSGSVIRLSDGLPSLHSIKSDSANQPRWIMAPLQPFVPSLVNRALRI